MALHICTKGLTMTECADEICVLSETIMELKYTSLNDASQLHTNINTSMYRFPRKRRARLSQQRTASCRRPVTNAINNLQQPVHFGLRSSPIFFNN
jgi:hypothetical protein